MGVGDQRMQTGSIKIWKVNKNDLVHQLCFIRRKNTEAQNAQLLCPYLVTKP